MVDLIQTAEQMRADLTANQHVVAACLFGSVQRQQTWVHSDIDLFVITDELVPRHEGVYLRRNQVLIHLQVLSLFSLRQRTSSPNGGPFFATLATGEVWFDKSGDLTTAIQSARRFEPPCTRLRACREFTNAVDCLHRAEKNLIHGNADDALDSALNGLHALAAATLADRGIYPPPSLWSHPLVGDSVERLMVRKLLAGGAPEPIVEEIWDKMRMELAIFTSPVLERLKALGVATTQQLMNDPHLQGITISERLLQEMVNQGLMDETEIHDTALGIQAIAFRSKAAS